MRTLWYDVQLRFRNKVILFWMFLFPIILCTLFSLVLRDVYALEEQTAIPLGIEMNEAYEQDATLQAVLQQLSEGEDALFSLEAAGGDVQEQLEQGKWIAYVQVMEDGEIALTMSGNGLEQTITEMFFDEFSQQRQLAQTWLEQGASSQELQSLFKQTRSYVTSMSAQQGITLEYVEYFSALAMACMYCGYFGIRSQQQLQANQSPLGMRLQCAPCPRHVVLIKELLCNNLICILLNVLQLAFMAGVLHISFGHSLYWVLGTTCLGSFAGNGLGLLIGNVASLRSEQKVTVLSCFVLLLSFLCGMMVPSVKYFVHVYAPFLEWINPCALLTDAYLHLSMQGANWNVCFDLLMLAGIGIVFYGISYLFMRRQQYESL